MLGARTLGRHDVDVDLLGAKGAPELPLGPIVELHGELGDVRFPRPDQPEVLLCRPACTQQGDSLLITSTRCPPFYSKNDCRHYYHLCMGSSNASPHCIASSQGRTPGDDQPCKACARYLRGCKTMDISTRHSTLCKKSQSRVECTPIVCWASPASNADNMTTAEGWGRALGGQNLAQSMNIGANSEASPFSR